MYKLLYNPIDGKLSGIKKISEGGSIPLCEANTDYQEFLIWNSEQKTPLDLNSTIEPVKPEPVRDLAAEITVQKAEIDELKIKVAGLETKTI